MSADTFSQMSTDDLIRRFVDEANHIGSVFSPEPLKVQFPSAEFSRGEEALRAIGAVLSLRKPMAQLRNSLFENESVDVRFWAWSQFKSIDPAWSFAAFYAAMRNLGTNEVMALRTRILQGPPPRPTLREMTTTQLLERFVDACERCYGTTRVLLDEEGGGTDMKAYNKASGEIYRIADELRGRGELADLLQFLDHPCVTVREKAGIYCLDIAPEKAAAGLDAIDGADVRHEASEASIMLVLWRGGKFKPFSKSPP